MTKIEGIKFGMSELQRLEVKRNNFEKYGSIFGSPLTGLQNIMQQENLMIPVTIRGQ